MEDLRIKGGNSELSLAIREIFNKNKIQDIRSFTPEFQVDVTFSDKKCWKRSKLYGDSQF